MFDLFFSAVSNTAHVQVVAQSRAAIVYLPISTKQSSSPRCVTHTATNYTGRTVRDVRYSIRNRQGIVSKLFLVSSLDNNKTRSFDICEGNSFVNVEAKQ